ncbi:hypothetical protein ACIQXD_04440 [Streptomyces uncialis]|uniref:hypothetical protein n=1 Tax=Streptomyces uncialis TaxID=1048205 RepID=UPI0037F38F70
MTMSSLADLAVPLRALRMLSTDHPGLPVPSVRVSPFHPDRLCLAFHSVSDMPLPLAAFEVWRAALGVPSAVVDGRFQSDGWTWVLKAWGEYAGATVELIAYADVPTAPSPVAGGAG